MIFATALKPSCSLSPSGISTDTFTSKVTTPCSFVAVELTLLILPSKTWSGNASIVTVAATPRSSSNTSISSTTPSTSTMPELMTCIIASNASTSLPTFTLTADT